VSDVPSPLVCCTPTGPPVTHYSRRIHPEIFSSCAFVHCTRSFGRDASFGKARLSPPGSCLHEHYNSTPRVLPSHSPCLCPWHLLVSPCLRGPVRPRARILILVSALLSGARFLACRRVSERNGSGLFPLAAQHGIVGSWTRNGPGPPWDVVRYCQRTR